MKTNQIVLFLFIFWPFWAFTQKVNSLTDYIDMRIGTSNDGSNCVIGPQLPFGSVNPSPQTPNGSHDGYNPDEPIRGFGQLQVSGTGWGKYGQLLVSPQIGLAIGESDHDSPKINEVPKPYEYGVTLSRYNIRTEFTPSFHSVVYLFIFPESDKSNILIDLSHSIPRNIATMIGGNISAGEIKISVSGTKITGYGVYNGGFGPGDYPVYFTAEFNRKPEKFGTWKNGSINPTSDNEKIDKLNDNVGAFLNFKTTNNDTLYMKIAVSFKSISKAEEWLQTEVSGFDYEKSKQTAKKIWENELSKINIETPSEERKIMFYSAMYHSMLMPRDRTSDMRAWNKDIPAWDDQYAVWDTWRTLFPLMTLIKPEMVAGNINSFIHRMDENKMVKDAFIAGYDMLEEQGGNNVDNIIVDGFIKKINGVDWEDAYRVIKFNADQKRNGWQGWGNNQVSDPLMDSYKKKGWIPSGTMSCSYTLEYAYNDYCAYLMAKGLGKTDDAQKYLERSGQWINLWNNKAKSDNYSGFIVPKTANNKFVDIDLKKDWGSWNNYYYEGSAWTYSYFIPHDFPKLVHISGGPEIYSNKLHHAMKNKLIDDSNEPAFLTAHSFIYAQRPDLASYWVRKLITEGFSQKGYPGNDDSGAMSSWYIFSSMGFFPNAGQDLYYLIGSLYPKIIVQLSDNKQIIIEAENASEENLYVQSCTLNGEKWDKAWITHRILADGATIKFVMGKQPSDWAKSDTSIIYKAADDNVSKKKK